MLNVFAATGGSVPLAAEPILHIGPLAITNSMLLGLITAVFVVILFSLAASRTSVKPRSGLAFFFETLVEAVVQVASDTFGSRQKALKHLPLLLSLFTFILVSNLSGLLPGVGTVTINTEEGVLPLLRPFTTDLNGTLALAILTIGTVQFYAIRELGIIQHLKHYFSDKPWNPMNLFIGLIEVMGEFIRIITLSMRLFGVIYAGEVLLAVIGSLSGSFAPLATLPVYLIEIFFSCIQAYLFVMLTSVYLALATRNEHEDHTAEDDERPVMQPVQSLKPEDAGIK